MARFGKRCEFDGYKFASEPERDFYIKLKKLKQNGKIKDFEVQPEFLLQEEFTTEFNERWDDVKIKEINIRPDYSATLNNGEKIYLDSKGSNQIEPESQLKRKMFLFQNRNVPLFYVGQLPKYLGGVWVCVDKGNDFLSKLKTRYNNVNFSDIIEHNKNKSKGEKNKQIPRSKPITWKVSDWDQHFEYDDVDGIFYKWKKTLPYKKELNK